MAEGLLRHLAGDQYDVASAGTEPVGLNPGAVDSMREIGIDISRHRSKRIDEFAGGHFDFVITVCDRAKETCPVFPKASTLLHWSFEDPAGATGTLEERRALFRRVRNEITDEVRHFIRTQRSASEAGEPPNPSAATSRSPGFRSQS